MSMRIDQAALMGAGAKQALSASKAAKESLQSLSTGMRINKAKDDAAGMAVAESFRSQARLFTQESANLQTGVSMVQTALSGIDSQQNAVNRLKELAVQASTGTANDDARAALHQEARQMLESIDDVARDTDFNGSKLLDGSKSSVDIANNQVQLAASRVSDLGLQDVDLSTQEGARQALDRLAEASRTLNQSGSSLGGQYNNLAREAAASEQAALNALEVESQIRDADVAKAVMEKTRQEALLDAGLAAVVHVKVMPQTVSRLLGQ